MTFPLMALAVGAMVAGFFGVPAALGGSNLIEHFLEPSFTATGHVAEEAAHHAYAVEWGLMAFSLLIAGTGIALAYRFYVTRPEISEQLADRFATPHRVLLNKYYVDELYNAVIVQPVKKLSSGLLWRGIDAGVIDGTVNAVGLVVRGWSAVLRRLQTGSVRAYAMSFFMGVVTILGYYLWR
jgi:NADH-quinone oxidoreductase subunit L